MSPPSWTLSRLALVSQAGIGTTKGTGTMSPSTGRNCQLRYLVDSSQSLGWLGVTREEHICLLIIIYNSTLVSRCVGAVYHLPPVRCLPDSYQDAFCTTARTGCVHRPILAHVFWQHRSNGVAHRHRGAQRHFKKRSLVGDVLVQLYDIEKEISRTLVAG